MLGEVDAGRHCGMRRSAQEQQLGDAKPQDVLYHRRPRCQGRIEAIGDQRIDLAEPAKPAAKEQPQPREIGGPKGPEPTRYGDWEVGGRCTDF